VLLLALWRCTAIRTAVGAVLLTYRAVSCQAACCAAFPAVLPGHTVFLRNGRAAHACQFVRVRMVPALWNMPCCKFIEPKAAIATQALPLDW
jgi:hypothetical protein